MVGENDNVQGKQSFLDMIRKVAGIFMWYEDELGRTGPVKHRIDTRDTDPIGQPPRRIPTHYQAEVCSVIVDMLKNNVIIESQSASEAPMVITKEKDGSLNLCIDYRKLNSVTHRDSFPLPAVDEIFAALGNFRFSATLDLASGY